MNKEFAPYEPSLALKELGFDEPCLMYFSDKSKELLSLSERDISFVQGTSNSTFTKAPLFQQAFRWFREKHSLKSWVQEHTADTFIYEIRPHVLTQYKQGETYVYTNYEEAELACLKKLIEIVKQ
jgi:hypothetical protein